MHYIIHFHLPITTIAVVATLFFFEGFFFSNSVNIFIKVVGVLTYPSAKYFVLLFEPLVFPASRTPISKLFQINLESSLLPILRLSSFSIPAILLLVFRLDATALLLLSPLKQKEKLLENQLQKDCGYKSKDGLLCCESVNSCAPFIAKKIWFGNAFS